MIRNICVMLYLLLFGQLAYSQNGLLKGAAANAYMSGSEQVRLTSLHEAPRFVQFGPNGAARAFSAAEWKQQLGLPKASELKKQAVQGGTSAFREVVQQYHLGYPVEGAVYYLHYNNKRQLLAANGQLWKNLPQQAVVGVAEPQALQQAKASSHFQGVATDLGAAKTELLFAPLRNAKGQILGHRLSYKIEVYSREPYRKAWVYIDAETGKELYAISRIHDTNTTGTAHTRYSGEQTISTKQEGDQYLLRDYSRGNGILTKSANRYYNYSYLTDITNSSTVWNQTANYADAAYDAHWGAMKTYDYFRQAFNRNSFDGSGATMNIIVHFGQNYNNAFWDGENMAFGDGSNSYGGFSPLTSIDVVAHEFTHAVTSYSANLVYAYESGALNESFSDIFGAVVEHFAKPQEANYLIGDEIRVGGGALRSMSNPKDYGDPDTYYGAYYVTGQEDNGGVHTNSGVQNYWFYLLAEGGAGTNDNGNAYSVAGIGMNKAAAIAYRNLTTYLTPNSTFEDAAFYAVRAAEDLYGSCSAEARATAQAWYAVGVTEYPSFETRAAFLANQTYSCSLQNPITFTNQSEGADSYLWTFGDGTTSIERNPVHLYSTAGVYTVSLTAYPTAQCGTEAHTLTKTAYITIQEGAQPVPASCTPILQETCCSVGIAQVQLGSFNLSTTEWEKGYNDYTCQHSLSLLQGERTNLQVRTRYQYGERLQVFIDWNNNGVFETGELVYSSNNQLLHNHTASFIVPTSAVLNQPLRLRMRSTALENIPNESCDNIRYGEVQDYTVRVSQNTQPPVADFEVVGPLVPNGDVTFRDNSQFVPTAWAWTFEGASVSSSSQQNPVVRFAQPGTYRVSLTASNAYGSTTTSREVWVSNERILCQDTGSSSPSGVLYDSGGKYGSYQNYERCSFIYQGCSSTPVYLNVKIEGIERGFDYLVIYDGPNASGTRLFHSDYSNGGNIVANSGSFYVYFHTDGSVTYQGFEISWNQQVSGSDPPLASFNVSDTKPALRTAVAFSNTSQRSTAYSWNFGDGSTSNEPNPSHAFARPGTYQVVLTATSCQGTSTASHSITVQEAPQVVANTSLRTLRLRQNETYNLQATISNTGSGDLAWEYLENLPEIITIWSKDANHSSISQILQNGSTHIFHYFGEQMGMSLKEMLALSNVFVLPQYFGNQQELIAAKADIQQFVERGGTFILAGQESATLNALGHFHSSSHAYISYGLLTRVNPSHMLLANTSGDFYAPYYTLSHTFSNSNGLQEILSYQGKTVVAVQPVGNGQAIYLGADYYYSNTNFVTLLRNAASVYSFPNASWINMDVKNGRIKSNASASLTSTISTVGLGIGEYKGSLNLWTNDTTQVMLRNRINLIVTNQATENFSWQQISSCGGAFSFVNESTLSNNRSFLWEFGDGSSSTQAFPEHTFALPGTYSVALTVTENGQTSKIIKSVTAHFLAAVPLVPDSARTSYPVAFEAAVKGSFSSLFWDFGDGYSASIANPRHAYDAPGEYRVRLSVKNAAGCDYVYEKLVVVGNFAALGLEEIPASDLALYPNPTKGRVFLKVPAGEWQLTLSDQQGRKVLTTLVQSYGESSELNFAALPKGLYILHITNNKQQAYRKLVVH